MRLLPILAAGFLAVAVLTLALPVPGSTRAATDIEVDNFYFCGASSQGGVCETTVNAGDTVAWSVNGGTHTVTECDDSFSACPPSGGFSSGTLSSGGSFSHTFSTAGTFEYRCNIHPSQMRGRITVVAQATPTPTAAPTQGASPTLAASPTPVKVPSTGGAPGGGGSPWAAALLALGGLALLAGAAGLTLRLRRV